MGRLGATLARAAGRRLAGGLLLAALVATACFAALHALPGDLAAHAAAARFGDDRLSAAAIEALRTGAGLDAPLPVQYGRWMARLLMGDPGRSLLTGQPVLTELLPRLRTTLAVGGLAAALALLLALPLGIAAGRRPGARLDRWSAAAGALLASTPAFVAGSLLLALVAVRWRLLPPDGWVLPAATLAAVLLPGLVRVVRHGTASVAAAPDARFARMRGVPAWRVALHIQARPALLPLAAYGPTLAMQLVEGFVTTELVFNLDGVGTLLVRSVLGRDLPTVMGAGIAFVLLLTAAVALADALRAALSP